MSKNPTSQPQHDAAPGPAAPIPGLDPMESWTRMTQEAISRMQAFYDELAAWEGKAYSRAKQTSEQLSTLASDTMTYLTDLAAEFRKVTIEATRRSAELFRARA